MVYKFVAMGCAALIACLAACSDDASPSFAGPAESSTESSSCAAVQSSSSSEIAAASSSSIDNVIESSAASSSSMTIEFSSSSETVSSSSSETTSSSSEEPAAEYFWNDEFDGESIDLNKWTFDIGTGASGWGNNEWEYYTDRKENAYVKDGVLHIRAQKEDYEGQKYTSARMLTKGKFAFKYGTVEARIALPTGKGIWPAFWMLGENFDTVGWPACGEIDIIEAVNSENKIYGTNHWANGTEYATYGNNTGDYRNQKFDLDITQFHTYKFTWDEKYIRMFVDDFMYHEILIEGNEGDTEEFHKPFFFLLNVAVAGNWPGFEVDDSQFPNEMLVDYIRVIK
ncbi:glycosyl hydrolase, family 16 [Fibrobacter succinogenes subsp. succinogenes S85]|uniref:Glycosyl hydrolase, family 16 n=2 Tax=Fibrobacter succinogenes (strain ATCC 19169 / S85) TaxID=59374 RepID=D9S628_FIBSS|nr:glycoside hydrolase family 16 protein [Fibrobacter succinogenes]ADL26448.1 glycosyl hydrolase, family 16 [Fibrobacter succinogenes subsp. succinogenes S85]